MPSRSSSRSGPPRELTDPPTVSTPLRDPGEATHTPEDQVGGTMTPKWDPIFKEYFIPPPDLGTIRATASSRRIAPLLQMPLLQVCDGRELGRDDLLQLLATPCHRLASAGVLLPLAVQLDDLA